MTRKDKICGNCGGFYCGYCKDKKMKRDALDCACEAHFRYWSSYEYKLNKRGAI